MHNLECAEHGEGPHFCFFRRFRECLTLFNLPVLSLALTGERSGEIERIVSDSGAFGGVRSSVKRDAYENRPEFCGI